MAKDIEVRFDLKYDVGRRLLLLKTQSSLLQEKVIIDTDNN